MTLLPQVQAELLTAARRPMLARRISLRAATAAVAAILVLLIAAPPTVAHLPPAVGFAASHAAHSDRGAMTAAAGYQLRLMGHRA